jgi:hypothetical protein
MNFRLTIVFPRYASGTSAATVVEGASIEGYYTPISNTCTESCTHTYQMSLDPASLFMKNHVFPF